MSAESEANYRLRILHVSDLHERGSRENEHWRRRRVLGNAWNATSRRYFKMAPSISCVSPEM